MPTSGGFFVPALNWSSFFAVIFRRYLFSCFASKGEWNVATGIVKLVQRDKGLWIYPARHWRQGDVFVPYLGCRESGSEQPE